MTRCFPLLCHGRLCGGNSPDAARSDIEGFQWSQSRDGIRDGSTDGVAGVSADRLRQQNISRPSLLLLALPAVSAAIFFLGTVVSLVCQPLGDAAWKEIAKDGHNYNIVKDEMVHTFSARHVYRIYKLVLYLIATVAEGWLLTIRWQELPYSEPVLPTAFNVFSAYRTLLACIELGLLFACWGDIWVNPGLGMFGWAASFSSDFPLETNKENLAHVTMAVVSSIGMCVLTYFRPLSTDSSAMSVGSRLLSGSLLVVAFTYPIYDSKHWYGGSHLSNLGGEYLPVWISISAVLRCRMALEKREPQRLDWWPFAQMVNRYIVVLLCIAALKTFTDLGRCNQSWGMPSTYPDKMPAECAVRIGSFNLSKAWKKLIMLVYFGGALLLFIKSELQLRSTPTRSGSCVTSSIPTLV